MKKLKFGKLSWNKETVSNLTNSEMASVKGGLLSMSNHFTHTDSGKHIVKEQRTIVIDGVRLNNDSNYTE